MTVILSPALSVAVAKVLWLVPLFYCRALFWLLHPPSLFFHITLVEGLWPETLKLIFGQFHQLGKVCLPTYLPTSIREHPLGTIMTVDNGTRSCHFDANKS